MAGALYDNKIKLSVEPMEEDRIPRLNRVIGFICALDNKILEKIKSLKDHEGVLTVEWLAIPIESEKSILSKAWLSQIGDGSSSVKHICN